MKIIYSLASLVVLILAPAAALSLSDQEETKGQVSTINKTLQTVQTRPLYQKTLLPDPKTLDGRK